MPDEIGVLGASGTTGSLIAAALERRRVRWRRLPRVVDTDAARGCRVLIHAGPSSAASQRALEAAAAAGACPAVVHLGGERGALRALFARDRACAADGVCVVGAAGISTVLPELAAWLTLQELGAPATHVTLVHGATTGTVPGRATIEALLADVDGGRDGHGAPLADDEVQVVELPPPVGPRAVRHVLLAEGLTLPRALAGGGATGGVARAPTVRSYVACGPPRAAAIRPPAYIDDRATLEQMLVLRRERGPPDAQERAAMGFALQATARGASGGGVVIDFTGADPYAVSAAAAVEVALAVADAPRPGAHAPLEVLEPGPALAALADAGVHWRVRR